MATAVVALIFLLPLVVAHNPFQNPLFGFHELFHPKHFNGQFASQKFHHEDEQGNIIHLEYEVEKSDSPILHLDEEEVFSTIDTLQCKTRELIIDFKSVPAAENVAVNLQPGILVTGTNWACPKEDGESWIIMSRIHKFTLKGKRLVVLTEEASYHHFFRNANISFSINKYPSDHFTQHMFEDSMGVEDSLTTRSTSSCTGFLKCVWEGVESLSGSVASAASSIFNTAKDIASGSISVNKSFKSNVANWNYANGKVVKVYNFGDYVSCTACYATLDLQLDLVLQITNYEVQQLSISATGIATVAVQAALNIKTSASSAKEYQLGVVNSPSIPFTVFGIPFSLQVSLTVAGGYQLQAQTNNIVLTSTATGKLTYGIQYTPSAGWTHISQQSLVPTGKISAPNAASGDAMVYLLPTISMVVDKIGGPYVGVKPFLELSAAVGTNVCNGKGPQVDLNWGYQVSVGAYIQVTLMGKEVIPKKQISWTVVSNKIPIFSNCITLGNSAGNIPYVPTTSSASTQIFPGHTWYGVLYPNTQGITSMSITFQYLAPASTQYVYQFMIAFNFMMKDLSQCFGQVAYNVSLKSATGGYTMEMQPVILSNGKADGWIECSVGNWYVDKQTTAFMSSDMKSISLKDAILKR